MHACVGRCYYLLDEVVQILGQLGREAGNLEDAQDLGSSHGLHLFKVDTHARTRRPNHAIA